MKRKSAFTLIELLITIVVMGIIVALALPQYTGYVAKSRQQDAKGQLMAIRQIEEIYKLQYGTYTADTAALGTEWRDTVGRYAFAITAADATTFTATATGNIDDDATNDVWSINENGNPQSVTNDLDS